MTQQRNLVVTCDTFVELLAKLDEATSLGWRVVERRYHRQRNVWLAELAKDAEAALQ